MSSKRPRPSAPNSRKTTTAKAAVKSVAKRASIKVAAAAGPSKPVAVRGAKAVAKIKLKAAAKAQSKPRAVTPPNTGAKKPALAVPVEKPLAKSTQATVKARPRLRQVRAPGKRAGAKRQGHGIALARFAVGDVVRHKFYPFRGVVFDIDPVFANTDEWWLSIPEQMRPKKNQPFYHLLAENAETEYIAYVSEQNLLPDTTGVPVRHPQVSDYFVEDEEGRYRPVFMSMLN